MGHLKSVWEGALILILLVLVFEKGFSQTILSNPSTCGLNASINDNSCPENRTFFQPNQFEISVTNAPGVNLGVDVYLKEVHLVVLHSWAADLDINLIDPSGQSIVLTSDNGGGEDNYGDYTIFDCNRPVTFAYQACQSIENGEAPFVDGPYLPEELFSQFNGRNTNPNGIWTLQICDDVPEDAGTLEYVNLVFEPITCLPVFEVALGNVDSTTVVIDWDPAGSCEEVVIELGPPGFTPGLGSNPGAGGATFTAGCPPYEIQGLQENTSYDVYVRKLCSTGNFSNNSCPITIETSCLPPAPTIVENFDDLSSCIPLCEDPCAVEGTWRNDLLDDFDWTVYNGNTPTFSTGPSNTLDGTGNYLFIETSSGCGTGKKAILNSNCIRINKQGTDTCHFSFNYHMFGQNIGRLIVEYTLDGGITWNGLWQIEGNQGNEWKKVYLSFAQFEDGDEVQFRIIGESGNGAKGDIAIDNIVFYGSEDLGIPTNQYYLDADGDGYGQDQTFFYSCEALNFSGFVLQGGDCNDDNPMINPGMPEIPCDNLDNNCSGTNPDDEFELPPPVAVGDTICSGETPEICATASIGRPIFWFNAPEGGEIVAFGNCYSPDLPLNNSSSPVSYVFYVAETDFICQSVSRTPVEVLILPNPGLMVVDPPAICPGDSIILNSISIIDTNYTGASITFHAGLPTSQSNQIDQLKVAPLNDINYYIRATAGQCFDEIIIPINVKPGPALTLIPSDSFSICKDDRVQLAVSTNDDSRNLEYLWDNGSTINNIFVDSDFFPGTTDAYNVTVTDESGCFSVGNFEVTTTTSIDSIRRSVTNVSDCGGNDGIIAVTPLNGTPPFNYQWDNGNGVNGSDSNGSGEFSISNLPQGTYRLTITDSSPEQCALVLRSIVVNGPSAQVTNIDIKNISCFGQVDGSICLDISGQNPSILWSNGETTPCIENLVPGDYNVTITDGVCETILNDLTIFLPDSLQVAFSPTYPTCSDLSDGALIANVFGGTPPYRYSWGNGSTNDEIENLGGGVYLITITDANDCELQQSFNLEAPSVLEVNLTDIKERACPGDNDGWIQVEAVGGTPPYNYLWSNGITTPLNAGLSIGSYSITITDGNGCQTTSSYVIEESTELSVEIVNANGPSCTGNRDGQIIVEVTGGSPPYQFFWNTGSRDSILSDLGVGKYSLEVFDANNCRTSILNITLDVVSNLAFTTSIIEPTCVGLENGSIEINPSGIAPYSYLWENGDSSRALNNIGVGNYGVTVVDALGCEVDTSISLGAPQVFEIEFGVFQPNCAVNDDGVINVNLIQAGQAPLDFKWNNGRDNQSLVGIGTGEYVLTVTDGVGCNFISDTIIMESPSKFELKVDGVGEINCYGESTGFIELTIEGGVPPYTTLWPDFGLRSEDIFNLPAGDYRVVIRDANDCPIDTTFVIAQPPELIANSFIEVAGVCDEAIANRLIGSATGGIPPYQFSWNNEGKGAIIELPETGDYALYVEDNNGCQDSIPSVKLKSKVEPIRLDTFYGTNISCSGVNDASLTAVVSGGSSSYRFHFSNNFIVNTQSDTVSTVDIIPNQSYRVTVTDLVTGCVVVSDQMEVTEPQELILKQDSVIMVNCPGDREGGIYLSLEGGIQPYQFEWRNELGEIISQEEDLTGIQEGAYSFTATDMNGCSVQSNNIFVETIAVPIHIVDSLTNVKNVNCFGGNTGAINLTLSHGKLPYDYSWSNGQESEDLNDLEKGAYQLTIADGNGCITIFDPFQIEEPEAPISISAFVQDALCAENGDGKLSVSVEGGSPPYLYSWKFEETILGNETSNQLDSIAAGTYFLIVRDTNKCVVEDSFEVMSPLPMELNFNVLDNGNGVSIESVVSGGTPPYDFLWNNGATSPRIDNVPGGEYKVEVLDRNGCMVSASTLITDIFTISIVRDFMVYPNPARNQVQIDLKLDRPLDLQVQLKSLNGSIIKHWVRGNVTALNEMLEIKMVPSGLYLLEVQSSNHQLIAASKLLILNN